MNRPVPLDTIGKKIHAALAQDIGSRILRGEFKPGSLLPNEAYWCRTFGVSRSALREAMKMLIAKGLVVSRPKIGSRVEPRERWNLLDRDVLAWYGSAPDRKQFLMSVQQMRYIFEPEAAALAALNRTPEQLAQIDAACREMGGVIELNPRLGRRKLHGEVAIGGLEPRHQLWTVRPLPGDDEGIVIGDVRLVDRP